MWLAHHETAVASGARIVHACGFDSIPHDLGAWFTVQQLSPDQPITLRGVVRSNATFSGGFFHSALGALDRDREMNAAFSECRKKEARTVGRSSQAAAGTPDRDKDHGQWLLTVPTIDWQLVSGSGAAPEYSGRSEEAG